jgi:hypothetical protein
MQAQLLSLLDELDHLGRSALERQKRNGFMMPEDGIAMVAAVMAKELQAAIVIGTKPQHIMEAGLLDPVTTGHPAELLASLDDRHRVKIVIQKILTLLQEAQSPKSDQPNRESEPATGEQQTQQAEKTNSEQSVLRWYILQQGQKKQGPFSLEELANLHLHGQVQIRREDASDWVNLQQACRRYPEFAGAFGHFAHDKLREKIPAGVAKSTRSRMGRSSSAGGWGRGAKEKCPYCRFPMPNVVLADACPSCNQCCIERDGQLWTVDEKYVHPNPIFSVILWEFEEGRTSRYQLPSRCCLCGGVSDRTAETALKRSGQSGVTVTTLTWSIWIPYCTVCPNGALVDRRLRETGGGLMDESDWSSCGLSFHWGDERSRDGSCARIRRNARHVPCVLSRASRTEPRHFQDEMSQVSFPFWLEWDCLLALQIGSQ